MSRSPVHPRSDPDASQPARSALRDAFLLMRPRQWPILTAQLGVGVVASPPMRAALAGDDPAAALLPLAAAWGVWVVALNGGTLAFNSAYDRDTEAVAYLEAPPPPPRGLAAGSTVLMTAGAVAGWLLDPTLGAVTTICVVLSILYSHPAVRLKGIPGADLAVNIVGYGAGTTLAGLAAGTRAVAGSGTALFDGLDRGGLLLAAGFALLFGSFYPMTQLYQLDADRRRGDRTLATALGARRSMVLAVLLGLAATAALVMAYRAWGLFPAASAAAGLAWLIHCFSWLKNADSLTPEDHERLMYRALAVWAVVDVVVVAGLFL